MIEINNTWHFVIAQVDCANYSGSSGCPILLSQDNSLAGVMYENISFCSNNDMIEIPNTCFMIHRDLINYIYNTIDCLPNKFDIFEAKKIFEDLIIFKMDDLDLFQKYFTYSKF